jgi:hypothetical protein
VYDNRRFQFNGLFAIIIASPLNIISGAFVVGRKRG